MAYIPAAMLKRHRGGESVPALIKYPRSTQKKKFITSILSAQADGNVHVLLNGVAVTYNGTVAGIRWGFGFTNASAHAVIACLLYILREGTTDISLSQGDATSLFGGLDPEDVLAFWSGTIDDGNSTPLNFMGNTRTMRKMNSGDKLQFRWATEGVQTVVCGGAFYVLYKS